MESADLAAKRPTPVEPAAATAPLTVAAISPDGDTPQSISLAPDGSGDYRFALQCLAGADAIHLEISVAGSMRMRAEVGAQSGETVRLAVQLDDTGEPLLQAGSHRVLLLPLEPRYGPLPPLPIPRRESAWDICLIVDATARSPAEPSGMLQPGKLAGADQRPSGPAPAVLDAFLLRQPKAWGALIESLIELVRGLGGQPGGCRVAIVAFGDEPPPDGVFASDLVPSFMIRHLSDERPERQLVPMAPEAIADLLLRRIKPTPGADFVDALADALAEAAELQWGDDTRRLVVLVGDSPGHRSADPVPHGGDALARSRDLDVEAARLHAERVEILTLYHAPPPTVRDALLESQLSLLDYARDQYRSLASQPSLAFTTASFDPKVALRALLERREPLGRSACWGRMVSKSENGSEL